MRWLQLQSGTSFDSSIGWFHDEHFAVTIPSAWPYVVALIGFAVYIGPNVWCFRLRHEVGVSDESFMAPEWVSALARGHAVEFFSTNVFTHRVTFVMDCALRISSSTWRVTSKAKAVGVCGMRLSTFSLTIAARLSR